MSDLVVNGGEGGVERWGSSRVWWVYGGVGVVCVVVVVWAAEVAG